MLFRSDVAVKERFHGGSARSMVRGACHALLFADWLKPEEFQVLCAPVNAVRSRAGDAALTL